LLLQQTLHLELLELDEMRQLELLNFLLFDPKPSFQIRLFPLLRIADLGWLLHTGRNLIDLLLLFDPKPSFQIRLFPLLRIADLGRLLHTGRSLIDLLVMSLVRISRHGGR
jgi:hypothetical protein